MPNQNLKDDILEATIQAFQKKGLKFTMDDIASLLGSAKKQSILFFLTKIHWFWRWLIIVFPRSKKVNKKFFKI